MESLGGMLETILYVAGGALGLAGLILVVKCIIGMGEIDKRADTLKEELDSRLDDINDLKQSKKPRSTPKVQYRNKI